MTKRVSIAACIVALILTVLAPVSASADTLQYHLDAFKLALARDTYAFNFEPAVVIVCDGSLSWIADTWITPLDVWVPDGVDANGCDIYMFHPDYVDRVGVAAPPAPNDLALAARHKAHSITAVSYSDGHLIFDTMTAPHDVWPAVNDPLWEKWAMDTMMDNARYEQGSIRARVNQAMRRFYAGTYAGLLVYTVKRIG